MPPLQTIRDMLETLNDSRPVPSEEALHVKSVATTLGASDRQVTTEQMRKAIAPWYLHVQRGETEQKQLLDAANESILYKMSTGLRSAQSLWSPSTDSRFGR